MKKVDLENIDRQTSIAVELLGMACDRLKDEPDATSSAVLRLIEAAQKAVQTARLLASSVPLEHATQYPPVQQ